MDVIKQIYATLGPKSRHAKWLQIQYYKRETVLASTYRVQLLREPLIYFLYTR